MFIFEANKFKTVSRLSFKWSLPTQKSHQYTMYKIERSQHLYFVAFASSAGKHNCGYFGFVCSTFNGIRVSKPCLTRIRGRTRGLNCSWCDVILGATAGFLMPAFWRKHCNTEANSWTSSLLMTQLSDRRESSALLDQFFGGVLGTICNSWALVWFLQLLWWCYKHFINAFCLII